MDVVCGVRKWVCACVCACTPKLLAARPPTITRLAFFTNCTDKYDSMNRIPIFLSLLVCFCTQVKGDPFCADGEILCREPIGCTNMTTWDRTCVDEQSLTTGLMRCTSSSEQFCGPACTLPENCRCRTGYQLCPDGQTCARTLTECTCLRSEFSAVSLVKCPDGMQNLWVIAVTDVIAVGSCINPQTEVCPSAGTCPSNMVWCWKRQGMSAHTNKHIAGLPQPYITFPTAYTYNTPTLTHTTLIKRKTTHT